MNTGDFNIRNNAKRIKNGDKIRNMNNEELARFMAKIMPCDLCILHKCDVDIDKWNVNDCMKQILSWLEQEG